MTSRRTTLDAPATSVAEYRVRGARQEMISGIRGYGEQRARLVLGMELTEEYTYSPALLRIGYREQFDAGTSVTSRTRLGVWEGLASSLSARMSGRSTSTDMIGLFDRFDIAEADESCVSLPRRGRAGRASNLRVLKHVEGAGVLAVKPITREVAPWIPRWRGTPVRGGQLYLDTRRPGRHVVVLVNDTTYTTIAPDDGVDDEALLNVLEDLECWWEDPGRAL